MYLLNLRKNKSTAHYWDGVDTACKMYTTGGMRKNRYTVTATNRNKPICTMCQNVNNKKQLFVDDEYVASVDNYFVVLPNV